MGDALRTQLFWFRLISFVGLIIVVAGVALLAQGNAIKAEAIDQNDPADYADMMEEAHEDISYGWGLLAVGVGLLATLYIAEFLFTNIEFRKRY